MNVQTNTKLNTVLKVRPVTDKQKVVKDNDIFKNTLGYAGGGAVWL